MTRSHLFLLIAGSLLSSASAETLIFLDNFNSGGPQYDLDSSPLAGRRSGTEAGLMLRSAQRQQVNFADQLYMWGSGGRVRIQTDTSNWCNFAALPSAAAILSAGGLCVEFDIRYTFNATAGHWIGFAVGMKGQSAGEPPVRVTDAETDYGFMIGKDGVYTRYKNGPTAIGVPVSGSSALGRHVKLEYAFTSFADGAPVKVKTTVAGQVISYDSFNWNGNSGELYMEMENRGSDTYFDDVKIATATVYSIGFVATNDFRTGAAAGTLVGDFSASTLLDESGVEASSYALVAGEGDTDNSKFSINSSGQLVMGSYDFKQGPAGTAYSIRVQGTGSQSSLTAQKVFSVVPIKDDDADMLPDAWELSFPGNTLSNLTGLVFGPGPGAGTGDFDNDGLDDLTEFQISLITPGYSPVSLDSDGDGIDDSEEENPSIEGHVITSAVLADTDRDGILDKAEYTAGTSPVLADTDGDGSRDLFEIDRGSNPLVYASRPALPPGFALVPITDDASSGISTSKTYTHKISGGGAATVNGVVFDVLTTTATPANFAWTVNGAKAAATTPNLGNWVAANGGVTGSGLQALYNTFTYAGVNDGAIQTFELSNLTPGQTYQVKLFIRKFSNDTLRPIDLTFTNGSDVQMPFGALLYDRPNVVLSNENGDSVYYVSYTYVAQGTTLKITAANPVSALPDSGSAHFYGLTNEVAPPPGSDLKILSVTRSPSGGITISFQGVASTVYHVTKSPNLTTAFVPLTIPVFVTTDPSGIGQVLVPAAEASEIKEFYRIEN